MKTSILKAALPNLTPVLRMIEYLVIILVQLAIAPAISQAQKNSRFTFMKQIRIGIGNITEKASYEDKNSELTRKSQNKAIGKSIEVCIRQVLPDLSKKYDFTFSDGLPDIRVGAAYKISGFEGQTLPYSGQEHSLTLSLVDSKASKVFGRFTAASKKSMLTNEILLHTPVLRMLEFLIQTRICSHTEVLKAARSNKHLESVMLDTVFQLGKNSRVDTTKLRGLLCNMLVGVQQRIKRTSKSFNLVKQLYPSAKVIVVTACFLPSKVAGICLLRLTFTRNGKTFFREKTLELDLGRIQSGDYIEFIARAYPQIVYLRSQMF